MPLEGQFTLAPMVYVESDALASHTVLRGTLAGSSKSWINKEMTDPQIARIELLAQEFFRLIIPHQVETRLLVNEVWGTHHIISEEIAGYRLLPLNEAARFSDGTYTGLGQAVLVSMFLQEIDLKNGNIGLDNQGRVIKIDGDWCLAGRLGGKYAAKNYGLTPNTIARLPYPTDFYTFNWLDLVVQSQAVAQSAIVNHDLSNAPQFRAEVNQAMLKIVLLPDSFIEGFVDSYMPAGGEAFVRLIRERRDELLNSAAQNESFIEYLSTDQAANDTKALILHMNAFQANGAQPIVAPLTQGATVAGVQARLDRSDVFMQLAINVLLDKLLSHKVNSNDELLQSYVDNMRRRLSDIGSNLEDLKALKAELSDTLNSVGSAEVIAVKNAAQSLRTNAHILTRRRSAKAERIEDALCNTPLDMRGTVISDEGEANLVQEALASHRRLGIGGHVYKKGSKIDIDKAANTFKSLKAQYKNIEPPMSATLEAESTPEPRSGQ